MTICHCHTRCRLCYFFFSPIQHYRSRKFGQHQLFSHMLLQSHIHFENNLDTHSFLLMNICEGHTRYIKLRFNFISPIQHCINRKFGHYQLFSHMLLHWHIHFENNLDIYYLPPMTICHHYNLCIKLLRFDHCLVHVLMHKYILPYH